MRPFVLAGVAILLSACTTARVTDSCTRQSILMHACISAQFLDEWDAIDESTLLLSTPQSSRAYLVHLARPIPDLLQAREIDVADVDLDRLICPCGRDGVIESMTGESARILSIEYLSEQRTAELLGMPSLIL